MGTNVYANGRSIACKAADGKSICAFPDVCLSPPSPPAGPVPIPYPNTGVASDTSGGSKSVKLGGKEAMLKDSSSFKSSTGDEAATKSLGMGVVSHQISGKVYFNSWSMDVKFEGENVPRMLDLMTHNHASKPGNTPTWPYIDAAAVAPGGACHGDVEREQKACEGCKPKGKKDPCPPHQAPKASAALEALKAKQKEAEAAGGVLGAADLASLKTLKAEFARKRRTYFETKADAHKGNACLQARRCLLPAYKPDLKKREAGCCPGQTGHHLIEAAAFLVPGTRKTGGVLKNPKLEYDLDRAPCVCAEGPDNTTATHGLMHTFQGVRAKKLAPNGKWKMKHAAETGAASVNMVFKGGCSHACLENQIKSYHEQAGVKEEDEIDAAPSGRTDSQEAEAAWEQYETTKGKVSTAAPFAAE